MVDAGGATGAADPGVPIGAADSGVVAGGAGGVRGSTVAAAECSIARDEETVAHPT